MAEPSEQSVKSSLSSSSSKVAESGCESAGWEILAPLSDVEQKRLSLIQGLCTAQQHPDYGQQQQVVATELGITLRSVRRLVQRYRTGGIEILLAQPRRDRGKAKISEEWQKFIVEIYVEGNRGSRSLTPLQVAVRVKVRAQELGATEYPSHMSVYRMLNPLIEQAQPGSISPLQ